MSFVETLVVDKDTSISIRLEDAMFSINELRNQPWFGNMWDYETMGLLPHQLPIAFAVCNGWPAGIIVGIVMVAGLWRTLAAFGKSLIAGGGSRRDSIDAWVFSGLALLSLSVAMTNGAMAVGYGFQWWVFGACAGFVNDREKPVASSGRSRARPHRRIREQLDGIAPDGVSLYSCQSKNGRYPRLKSRN